MLAAGEGVRMRPLTERAPKQLQMLHGKPLIEYIFERVPDEVSEFIIVIGYKGDMIKDYCKDSFLGRPVTYIAQPEKTGTYCALELARNLLKDGERFLMLYGDDLHGARGMRDLLRHSRALLVHEVENPRAYGVIEVDASMMVTDIIEKPENPKSNLISSGVMVLDTNVFLYPPTVPRGGEYFLPDAIAQMLPKYPIAAVRSSFWFPVTTPEDLARANEFLAEPSNIEKLS